MRRFGLKVNYGNKLVNELHDTRRRELLALQPNPDLPVTLNQEQRRDLKRLVVLRQEMNSLEAKFKAVGLDTREGRVHSNVEALPHSYEWKEREEKKRNAKLQPKFDALHKLRQQAQIDLMAAEDRKAQAAIISAYQKALANVR